MAITIKTKEEIEILKKSGRILADVLKELQVLAKPGVSTGFLDKKAESMILARGGEPAFLNYHPAFMEKPYPASLCASLNNVIVHGLPSEKDILKNGDILKLDLGVKYKNLFTDSAVTIGIGELTEEKQKLINFTKRALELAIDEVKPDNHIGDIGFAIENYIESNGFYVIEILVGHGVGHAIHEEPNVPNYGKKGSGPQLRAGMVIAIEPMVSLKGKDVVLSKDGFGYETLSGSLSAHFEHTVAVTEYGNEVLTK